MLIQTRMSFVINIDLTVTVWQLCYRALLPSHKKNRRILMFSFTVLLHVF